MIDKQRMAEILERERQYRQFGRENLAEAHDDIDYLWTQLKLQVAKNEHLKRIADASKPLAVAIRGCIEDSVDVGTEERFKALLVVYDHAVSDTVQPPPEAKPDGFTFPDGWWEG